ncbi:MAG: DUF5684 domain-containing protein, partial [Pseudoclavibacter sp.]|nr:DUF5684 domain-containing protein [Pseudoclavibacter sp.]
MLLSSYDGGGAALAIGNLFSFLFQVAIYIVTSIFLSKMFKKMGIEGWMAWVPILNFWKLFEAGGQAGWWCLVPFANIYFGILAYMNVSKAFGKDAMYAILGFLLFPVWTILLASPSLPWQPQLMAPARPLTGNAGGMQAPYGAQPYGQTGQPAVGYGQQQPGYGQQP